MGEEKRCAVGLETFFGEEIAEISSPLSGIQIGDFVDTDQWNCWIIGWKTALEVVPDRLMDVLEAKASSPLMGAGEVFADPFIQPLGEPGTRPVHAEMGYLVDHQVFVRHRLQSATRPAAEEMLRVNDHALFGPEIHARRSQLPSLGDITCIVVEDDDFEPLCLGRLKKGQGMGSHGLNRGVGHGGKPLQGALRDARRGNEFEAPGVPHLATVAFLDELQGRSLSRDRRRELGAESSQDRQKATNPPHGDRIARDLIESKNGRSVDRLAIPDICDFQETGCSDGGFT